MNELYTRMSVYLELDSVDSSTRKVTRVSGGGNLKTTALYGVIVGWVAGVKGGCGT